MSKSLFARSRSWSRRAIVGLLLAGAGAFALVEATASSATNPTTQNIANGFAQVQSAVAALATPVTSDTGDHLALLQGRLPVTSMDPLGSAGLDITHVMSTALDLSGHLDDDPAQLAGDLTRSTTTTGGATVTVGCGSGTSCSNPVTYAQNGTVDSYVIPISVTKSVSTQVNIPSDVADLAGSGSANSISANVSLSTTLDVSYDTSVSDPAQAFTLTTLPSFAVSMSLANPTTPVNFTADFGFTQVTVGLNITAANLGFTINMNSPHTGAGATDVGELTAYDLQTLAATDLYTVSRTAAFSGDAFLDSTLLPAPTGPATHNVDVAITMDGTTLQPSFSVNGGTTSTSLRSALGSVNLTDFLQATPTQILGGVGQLAANVQSLQNALNVPLPLLHDGLAGTLQVINQLTSALKAQTVVCGSVDGNPLPSGSLFGLHHGDSVYCRAVTPDANAGTAQSAAPAGATDVVQSGSIQWAVLAGTGSLATDGSDTANTTVGTTPSASARFTVSTDGVPPVISVNYRTTDYANPTGPATSRSASQAPPTAQDLLSMLTGPGGFSTGGFTVGGVNYPASSIAYDPSTHALTFHLTKDIPTGTTGTTMSIGDLLTKQGATNQSGLLGVSDPNAGASPPTPDITVTANDAVLDLTFGVLLIPDLSQIQGYTPEIGHPGTPDPLDRFFIQTDGTNPVLSVNDASISGNFTLNARLGFLGVSVTGSTSGGNAFTIGRADTAHPILALGLQNNSGITIGSGGPSIPNAITMPDLIQHLTNDVSITPNIQAAGGLTASATLAGGSPLSGTINFTWGPITSASDLTNGTGLAITTNSNWTDFENQFRSFFDIGLNGGSFDPSNYDPEALLGIVLNGISGITDQLGGASAGGFLNTQLPLLNTSPKQLISQFQKLKTAVEELKGAPSEQISCTQISAGTGNPSGVPATTAQGGDTIGCQVQGANVTTGTGGTPASNVQWTVTNGTNAGTAHDTDPATIVGTGTAADLYTFTLNSGVHGIAGPNNSSGFSVHVTYTDTTGNHTVDLPVQGAPATLQSLATALTNRLGLPAGAITLTVDASDPVAGGSGNAQTLRIGLNYGLCTAGATDLTCPTTSAQMDPIPVPLGLSLSSSSSPLLQGLSLSSSGTANLEYAGSANFDFGIPISGSTHTPEIFDDTGVTGAVALSTNDFHGTASLGPLSLQVGTSAVDASNNPGDSTIEGRVGFAVSQSGADPHNPQPMTPDSFVTGLSGQFGTASADGSGNGTSGLPTTPDCGNVVTDPSTSPATTQDVSGIICARLGIDLQAGSATTQLGDLGFAFDPSHTPSVTLAYRNDLAQQVQNGVFNVDFLLKALPGLIAQLQQTLSNAGQTVRLPVIGDALTAGADVVGQLNTAFTPIANGFASVLNSSASNPVDLKNDIENYLYNQVLGPSQANLLLGNGSAPGPGDLNLVLTCSNGGDHTCTSSDSLTDISDAHFHFWIGQGVGNDATTANPSACTATPKPAQCSSNSGVIPFDVGVNGLPLRVTGSLQAGVGWKALLDFGLSRTSGPYLVVNHDSSASGRGSSPYDVEVGANVGLADSASSCVDDSSAFNSSDSSFGGFNDSHCLQGTLGFLTVEARDGSGAFDPNGSPSPTSATGIQLVAGVNLTDPTDTSTANKQVSITDISSGHLGATFGVNAIANANLLVHVGVSGAGATIPSVYGQVHAHWHWGTGLNPSNAGSLDGGSSADEGAPSISLNHLYLDAGTFIGQYLSPIVNQIKGVTSPFKPVLDVITTPIPVVSQLAAMVGQSPVTLLGLAEQLGSSGGTDLSFINSLVEFIKFANSLPSGNNIQLISLGSGSNGGSFTLNPQKLETAQPPDDAGGVICTNSSGGCTAQDAASDGSVLNSVNSSESLPANSSPTGCTSSAHDFGVCGLSFPFVDHPSNLFQLMMGQDVTLVDYQFGGLNATAGFDYTFGPFMVGPVPVSVVIGGSVGLQGHLGIGYDTSGLREVINGSGAGALLDGLFFDENDAAGNPTPILALTGTVTAGAEVDLEIVKAGIEAGLTLTTDFWFDDPTPGDGKMSFQDIGSRLNNPICLFRVTGSLDAFIRAFVEFDFFVGSDRLDWTILTLHLLDFSGACSPANPPPPAPATFDATHGWLIVNVGPRAGQRNYQGDVHDETVTVTPVADKIGRDSGGNDTGNAVAYQVTVLGVTGTYGSDTQPVTRVYVDGGDGNDTIKLGPGSDTSCNGCASTPHVLSFLASATVCGGPGNDTITGGDGGDYLYGGSCVGDGDNGHGAGNDKITGGSGNDRIFGGDMSTGLSNDSGGADNLSAGNGNDFICAGSYDPSSANDCAAGHGPAIIHGGGGSDVEIGSGAADVMDGGPGLDPSASDPNNSGHTYGQSTDPLVQAALDGDNYLVGNDGTDTLTGGPGNNVISGGPDQGPGAASSITGATSPAVPALPPSLGLTAPGSPSALSNTPNTTCTDNGNVDHNGDVGSSSTIDGANIVAGNGNNLVWGTNNTDKIQVGNGSNWVCAMAGDDQISIQNSGAGNGTNTLLGGSGNDVITGGTGTGTSNVELGQAGNDSLTGGSGPDILIGGTGRDYLDGGNGNTSTVRNDGNNIVIGDDGSVGGHDEASLSALGYDQVASNSTTLSTLISNLSGMDAVTRAGHVSDSSSTSPDTDGSNAQCSYGQTDTTSGDADCMFGGSQSDVLYGGDGADQMNAGAGDDYVNGGSGNDNMRGGDGDDTMYGGAGNDTTYGDAGADSLYGDNGPDGAAPVSGETYNDAMYGGEGNDYMEGNLGADTMNGDTGDDRIIGGSSRAGMSDQNTDTGDGTGTHGDTLDGGDGTDTIVGDNGTISSSQTVVIFDSCAPSIGGDDAITGDFGADALYGGNRNDTIHGGEGDDYIEGNDGADHVYGDNGNDQMIGGSGNDTSADGTTTQDSTLACDGNDTMSGGDGNDVMLGDNGVINTDGTTSMAASAASGTSGFGNDVMQGDLGQDQMYGEQGNDTMTGDAGEDYLIGDLGSISGATSGPATWPGGAPNHTVSLISPDTGGNDVMYGSAADDHLYGGAGNDVIQGGAGDDYLEGNAGSDSMYGLDDNVDGSSCSTSVSTFDCSQAAQDVLDLAVAGATEQDDMIGGSSPVNPDYPSATDTGETVMKGNLGTDVMIGDNGTITRTVSGSSWAVDPITGGAARTVALANPTVTDCTGTPVCGDDTMEGDAGNDRLYGEGGSDTIDGDATGPNQRVSAGHAVTIGVPGDDYVEGNQGNDIIHGDEGDDDLVGGSSEVASGSGDGRIGEPDTGDTIDGDTGEDVIAGDNAKISKLGQCPNTNTGDPITQGLPLMSTCQRTITLLDLGTSTVGNYGDDTINGGDGNDIVFGESGHDTIHGDNGDDYLEGNQGADTISGDAGQDDILGGSSHIATGDAAAQTAVGEPDTGDTISGGDDSDVILGDNGQILRIDTTTTPTTPTNTLEDTTLNRDGIAIRNIALFDLGDNPTPGTSGGDYIEGNGASDVILGQDGNDRIKGGDGNDYAEGGPGIDSIEGNDGEDDLIGGSSTPETGHQAALSNDFAAQPALGDASVGQPDQPDLVYGGAGDDMVTGDNAAVSRVGATALTLSTRLSSTNPGQLITPRSLQLLDLKNSGSYLTAPASIRYGDDSLSGDSGNDVLYGQDGNDAISGGGGDDYIEGNSGEDTIRGDLLLSDTAPNDPGPSVLSPPKPETTVPAFSDPGWPGSPSTGADLQGTGATPAGQDDIIGGSSIPGFRDTGDAIEGDGEADFVLGDNGTMARVLQGSAGSYTNQVFAARYPTGQAPANAVVIRQHDPAVNAKYGTNFPTTRFCTQPGSPSNSSTCEVTGSYGNDRLYGDAGDDTMWGQDGDDYIRGGAGNDDMYGEMGDDAMFGDGGQDAMVGDRGGIVDTYINGTAGGQSTDPDRKTFTVSITAPPAISYTGFVAGTVDRRVDLTHDIDGDHFIGSGKTGFMPLNGMQYGGNDLLRGGNGRDSMHGGNGDDTMNGDSGGDTLFGDDGADVIWGGRGCDPASPEDSVPAGQSCAYPNDATQEGTAGSYLNTRDAVETVPGTGQTFTLTDGNVDYIFAGHGGTSTASQQGALGADILDWRPRGSDAIPGTVDSLGVVTPPNATCVSNSVWPVTPGTGTTLDPCSWLVDTNADDDNNPASPDNAHDATIQNNQHHQGIDWMYGGWDRDVLQADVADNGPNPGDRLLDWDGAYNLYTHCNAAYGGFNDVRQLSPAEQSFVQQWSYAVGAGQIGSNDVTTSGTSAFDELALVYPSDIKSNTGKSYPTTPGHFDNPNSCGL